MLFRSGVPIRGDITGTITGNLVGTVSTLTTYTGNTVQTGDSFARLGVAGIGLTNLGDTRIANLDATITSRTKPADTQAAVTLVATTTNVTNAPTNGDFTAVMKTSLDAATPTPPAASIRSAVGLASANLDTQLTNIQTPVTVLKNFAEGDEFIDTGTTPWNAVVTVKGTLTELARKVIRDIDGVGVTSTDTVVASEKES